MSVLYEGGADWGLDGNALLNQNNTSGVSSRGLSIPFKGLTSQFTNNGGLPSISNDILSSYQTDYALSNPGAPTKSAAAIQAAANGGGDKETGMFGGLGDWMNDMGITSKDGSIFGINKAQQEGLGQLAGLGSGLWNMYNANQQFGMMKDYYNKQNALQDEQMGRVRKEDAHMEGLRSGLSKRYGE